MNLVTALFLVILLASSSYAAGRLHAQLGYRLGFRTGYRQGFGDGDRAAWLYRRKEALRDAGSMPTSAVPATSAMPAVMTVATPPATQAAPPAGPSRRAGQPALAQLVIPAGRGVGMRGTMYHSTGALAIRGGRHAHPE